MSVTRLHIPFILVALLVGCTTVPEQIRAPSGDRHLMSWQATGNWVYHCRLSNDGQRLAWATLRPDAELRTASGQVVGRIAAGPNLVHQDGSVAELTLRTQTEMAGALPWALYEARSEGSAGVLAAVTSAQQVRTTGGAVPTAGCSNGEQVMNERAVPFTAEFRLYGR